MNQLIATHRRFLISYLATDQELMMIGRYSLSISTYVKLLCMLILFIFFPFAGYCHVAPGKNRYHLHMYGLFNAFQEVYIGQ